jgi:hypothetical protein
MGLLLAEPTCSMVSEAVLNMFFFCHLTTLHYPEAHPFQSRTHRLGALAGPELNRIDSPC